MTLEKRALLTSILTFAVCICYYFIARIFARANGSASHEIKRAKGKGELGLSLFPMGMQ